MGLNNIACHWVELVIQGFMKETKNIYALQHLLYFKYQLVQIHIYNMAVCGSIHYNKY